jgi:phosphopentomutase
MKRAFILLMDSFGIGYTADAAKFGDVGANTFYHIAEACMQGKADIPNVRQGVLKIPNLIKLGLNAACIAASSQGGAPGLATDIIPQGLYGYAAELSFGKDTPSGHWEIAGVPVMFEWGYFSANYPSFPQELVDALIVKAQLPGILGNCHASGTEIINKFGEEHVRTGKPICYTSADSVLQIAAHEEAFGLERLYEVCKVAYELVKPYNIGRIIARPFLGEAGNFFRTEHRRDYSVKPPAPTLLEQFVNAGGTTIAIGKVADIFAHQGISKHIDAHGNDKLFQATIEQAKIAPDKSLIFTNFVDFDMKFGHRRDVANYALALEKFDAMLPQFEVLLQPGDIAIITADHGCDPTFKSTDHTREYIPVLVFGPNISGRNIGRRDTFADIGQSLAQYFGIKPLKYGKAFL